MENNNNKTFEIQFVDNCFKLGDIVLTVEGDKGKIVRTKKWYKLFLQFITLGIYKAPYQYKIKLINQP